MPVSCCGLGSLTASFVLVRFCFEFFVSKRGRGESGGRVRTYGAVVLVWGLCIKQWLLREGGGKGEGGTTLDPGVGEANRSAITTCVLGRLVVASPESRG